MFLFSLVVEDDDATCFVSEGDVVACGVVADARDDVFVEDAFVGTFVTEYLRVFVVGCLAWGLLFH